MLDGALPSGTWIADAHGKSGSSRNASWVSAGYVGASAPATTAAARTSRPAPRTAAGLAEPARGGSDEPAPPRFGPPGPSARRPPETLLPLRPFRPVVWRSPVRTVSHRPSPGPLRRFSGGGMVGVAQLAEHLVVVPVLNRLFCAHRRRSAGVSGGPGPPVRSTWGAHPRSAPNRLGAGARLGAATGA
jgi:hypothetical protein